MSRTEWTRRTPEEVESVVAFMLCREFPNAIRIRPSQGDGGIDLMVPSPGGVTIYQVKSFAENLTTGQKNQIQRSFDTLLAYAAKDNLHVLEWFLVMPLDPTREQLRWLQHVTSQGDFPRTWHGLAYVEGLAAKYPDVIDYYLFEGKERLQDVLERFLTLAGLQNPAQPPAASQHTLDDLYQALNEFDPHYRYHFSVGEVDVVGNCPPVVDPPGCVCTVRKREGNRCITHHIVARCAESLKERPITGGLTLQAESGTELAQQILDWGKYGTPLQNAPAHDVRIDLPGGFAPPVGDAQISIGASPPIQGAPDRTTLRCLGPAGTVVASLDFGTDQIAAAPDRQGVWSSGHDLATSLLHYEFRGRKGDATSAVTLSWSDPEGHAPADLLPVLRFIGSTAPPNRLQMFAHNGPAVTPPAALPQALADAEMIQIVIRICQSLATIQEHTLSQILLPPLCQESPDSFAQWEQAARLLRGESLTSTWNNVQLHLKPGEVLPPIQEPLVANTPLIVQIAGKDYELGTMSTQPATVRVDESRTPTRHGDHDDAWLIPGQDDSAVIRWADPSA